MALNDAMTKDVANRLKDISSDDLSVLVSALSLGFRPDGLHSAITRVANGEEVLAPSKLGEPRPLKIVAWSFVNDHGQFSDTYGLTDARAGELKGLLRSDLDKGVKEITDIVTAALRKKGSTRPIIVITDGMPGTGKTDHSSPPGKTGGVDLKQEIVRNPTLYGMYNFLAEDTGRPGAQRFSVALGGGLYAVAASKKGAIDAARICRVKGREFELIRGMICFWREGKTPLFGPDIPSKVDFDGCLKPGQDPPAEPLSKGKTVAESE